MEVDFVRLSIIGGGSLRCGVPVIASLATYFGERPLQVAMWDSDHERLHLFESFARAAFHSNKNPHEVFSSIEYHEILNGAERVILQLDEHCADKEAEVAGIWSRARGADLISETLERIAPYVPNDAAVLSLLPPGVRVPLNYYYRVDWPENVREEDLWTLPHQIMRWIRGEEYFYEIYDKYEKSPLKAWLDDVSTATAVSEG